MVSANERARLIENYRHDPAYTGAVLLKCAACLAVLAGIGVMGATIDTSADAQNTPAVHVVKRGPG